MNAVVSYPSCGAKSLAKAPQRRCRPCACAGHRRQPGWFDIFIKEFLITRIFPLCNFCLNLYCNYLNKLFMSTVEFNQMLVNNAEFLKPFAITLTRDSEAAKDLFQETLYRALANKDKYSVGTNIKAWLYTIMRNIFINNYRRKVKQNTI